MYIVTGASSGIGRAVAKALATRGHQVTAIARNKQKLAELASTCSPLVTPVSADLSSAAGIASVVDVLGSPAKIEGIVHSAGSLVPLEPYQSLNTNELVSHFRIHVAAPIALYQSLTKSAQVDRMLFIDSYSASAVRMGWSAYSIVKSAAQMAAKCAQQELPDTDCVRVFPGAVNTQIVDTILASDTETAHTFKGMLERGELAQPHEVAEFIAAILIDAPRDLIRTRPAWDFNDQGDRDRIMNV